MIFLKKISLIIIIFLILISNSLGKNYKIGDKIYDEFEFSKKIKIKLEPEGEWRIIRKENWFHGNIKTEMTGLALIKEKKIVALKEFQSGSFAGWRISDVNMALNEYFYGDKSDGCNQIAKYTLIRLYHKGSTTNCFFISHIDVRKEMYNPDDEKKLENTVQYRKYIDANNLDLPNVMLQSFHGYFSQLNGSRVFTINSFLDPSFQNGPISQFIDENINEFHPFNINNFQEFKIYMDQFVKKSIKKHIIFEEKISTKDNHKLNFQEFNITNNEKNKQEDISEQINSIRKLLDSGILTQEEFVKAKNKILN